MFTSTVKGPASGLSGWSNLIGKVSINGQFGGRLWNGNIATAPALTGANTARRLYTTTSSPLGRVITKQEKKVKTVLAQRMSLYSLYRSRVL